MNFFKDFQSEIKTFFLVTTVAIVLSVGGVLLLRGLSPAPVEPTPPAAQQIPPPSPQPQVLDTSNWQTYRSDEFGFEVRYPKDDQCDLVEVGGNSWSFGRINLDVLDAEGFSLEEYVEDFVEKRSQEPYGWVFGSTQQTEVGDREAIALSYRFGGLNRLAETTFVRQGENVYVLSWSAGGFICNEPEIFPQILSTFRFVDEKESLKIDPNVVWELVPALRDCTRVQLECVPSRVKIIRSSTAGNRFIEPVAKTGGFGYNKGIKRLILER